MRIPTSVLAIAFRFLHGPSEVRGRKKFLSLGLAPPFVATTIFGAILMFAIANSAQAVPIRLEFTVSDIPPSFAGVPAPTNPASGVIEYEAAALGATIDSLTSISLDVGNHSFTLAEVSFESPFGIGDVDLIGATINGLSGVTTLTSDFLFLYDRVAGEGIEFRYASSDVVGIWVGDNFTDFSLTVVPEPHALSLLVLGLLGVAAVRCRSVA